MPLNDEKVLENLLKDFDNLPKDSIKDFLKRYFQRAYYYEDEPKIHKRSKLKDGTERTYYIFHIPTYAIDQKKIIPGQKYRIELYPIKEEKENS